MKVVIDTNILISAFLFQGIPRRVLQACIDHHHVLCFSDLLMDEFVAVVNRPEFVSHLGYGEAVRMFQLIREKSVIAHEIPKISVCRDPKDDMVIATALATHARFVITGDKDLTSLKKYKDVRFLTPREFPSLS